MSRTMKLWACGVPFVVAILWLAGIALQAFMSNGTMAAAPAAVTSEGWLQVVVAIITALESGKGWLSAMRAAATQAAAKLPGPQGEVVRVSIDVATVSYYKWLLTKVTDKGQQTDIINGARKEMDAIRDREFPLPTS